MSTTIHERQAGRLREILVFLAQQDTQTHVEPIVAQVAAKYPPEGAELEMVRENTPRWTVTFHFQSSSLVKARWLHKDGHGYWSITEAGRKALEDYPSPDEFQAEAYRRYAEWDQARKAEQRRAWLVRGSSVRGTSVVKDWLEGGWVSLPASQLRTIEEGITAEALAVAAAEDYDHLKHQELKSKVDEILAFVTKMKAGDIVLTTSEQMIYVGDVTGDWTWQASEDLRSNLRRPVEWRNVDAPIDFADLPNPLPAKLASGANVVDLTSELDLIDSLTAPAVDPGGFESGGSETLPVHQHLAQPSSALADNLLVDSAWLTSVRDLLDERKQIIFYGPPGTGKTFVARKLAADLVGPEQVKLVQFHPAYTYEDFFEGYRPRSENEGTIGFDLRPGPLRQLVSRAIEHRDQAFVLIIDEINRANLAKVFGELYFLLEYRDDAVELLYSAGDEPFTLPPNIYLIGTMNTADRSIALVDSAMRRRFAFVALDPRTEPTKSLLRRWSARHGLGATAARLVDELNKRIDDPDFQIGPSYFMRSTAADAFSQERLERIWSADIQPLLEERFYGQWASMADRYSLGSLLKMLPAVPAEIDVTGVSGGVVGDDNEPAFSPEDEPADETS